MPANRRPIPDDFAEVAPTMSINDLCRHYNAGGKAVNRWCEEIGRQPLEANPTRPIPADFRKQAQTLGVNQLRAHYNAGAGTIYRWLELCGIEKKIYQNFAEPVPADFADRCKEMTQIELCRHYGRSRGIIARWCKKSGATPMVFLRAQPSRSAPNLGRMGRVSYGQLIPTKTRSFLDEAADVLRRERFKVNRCGPKGEYDPKGNLWRCGWSILTDDELLAKADRYRSRAA